MYPIITHKRNRRRSRISKDYNFRLNQLVKILETYYLDLLNSPEKLAIKLGKHWLNSEKQCIWDIYVDQDCPQLIYSAIKIVEWRKVNDKLRHTSALSSYSLT